MRAAFVGWKSPEQAHVVLAARSHHTVPQVRQHVPERAAVAVQENATFWREKKKLNIGDRTHFYNQKETMY